MIEIAVLVALGVAVAKADSLNVGDANDNTKHPTYVTLDPPGSVATIAKAINPRGDIVGVYLDSSNVEHGFLRAPDGIFTTIDAPGAGTASEQGTVTWSINPAGAIAGLYIDSSNVFHGYLRTPDGTSPHSTFLAQAQPPDRAPWRKTSTPLARSQDHIRTTTPLITASYALRTAPSPHSTFLARARAPARAPAPPASTRQ
jgi:hypothetical protein